MNLITMKQYLLALLALISVSTATYAQSKVAHIDVQQLLMDMPEMKAAQEELKKLEATYRADIESSVAELQKNWLLIRTKRLRKQLKKIRLEQMSYKEQSATLVTLSKLQWVNCNANSKTFLHLFLKRLNWLLKKWPKLKALITLWMPAQDQD